MMSQKAAVAQAISQVLSNAGITVPDGTSVKSLMTNELRSQVNQILFEGFRAGNIEIKVEKNDTELKAYVSGLQSNWLNKDTNLTGGVKYVIKNPGSRTGVGDAQVKALRGLLATVETDEEKAEIQGYLNDRLAEIEASKPKAKKKVDFSSLPAELAAKYSA